MGDIVLAGATSGTITLQPTAVAGSSTLTLPAANATIITTASSGQSIPKAALPTGSVLQVVNATYATSMSANSTAYTDTGLTASITPTSSSSKILIFVSQNGVYKNDVNTGNSVNLRLVRNGTSIGVFAIATGYTGALSQNIVTASFNYLDSPATTSALTYKVEFANYANSGTVYVQANNDISAITLMEIAA